MNESELFRKNEERFLSEYLELTFQYINEDERSHKIYNPLVRDAYFRAMFAALRLTRINGDWAWYDQQKHKCNSPGGSKYRKFLEAEIDYTRNRYEQDKKDDSEMDEILKEALDLEAGK